MTKPVTLITLDSPSAHAETINHCSPISEACFKTINIFVREYRNPSYSFIGFVEKEAVRKKRKGRGCPKKDEVPQYQEVDQLHIHLNPLDVETGAKEKNRLSCFVLISKI